MPSHAVAWDATDLLPGLVLVALAWLLGRQLSRLGDPIPLRAWALFAGATLALLGLVLFAGRTLQPVDGLRGEVPFLALAATEPPGNPLHGDALRLLGPADLAVREAIARGEWPLWSPRVGAGMPLLGDPQAQALSPLASFARAWPWLEAAGVLAATKLLVAFAFCFAYLRRLGAGDDGALVGALAWTLGGAVQLWIAWPLASVAALLPAGLYAVVRLSEPVSEDIDTRPSFRPFLLAVLVFASLLTAGHPETIAYAVAVLLLQAILTRRRLGRVAAAFAIATLLSAPAWLLAVNATPRSERAVALRQDARSFDVRRIAAVLGPSLFGNNRFATGDGLEYWGPRNVNEDSFGFPGGIAWLAALGTIATIGTMGRQSIRADPAALWVFTGFIGLGLAAWNPNLRTALLFGFAAAVLLGLQTGRLLTSAQAVPSLRALARRALLAGGLATGFLLALAAIGALWPPSTPTAVELVRSGWWRFEVKVLALAVLLWILAPLLASVRARSRWLAVSIAALVAAELLVAHAPANPIGPRQRSLPQTGVIETLERVHAGPQGRVAALDAAWPASMAALWGFAEARSYNPMSPQRYREWLAPVLAPGSGPMVLVQVDDPILDALSLRWLLTAPGSRTGDARIARALENGTLRPAYLGMDAEIFERADARPLVAVLHDDLGTQWSAASQLSITPAHWSARVADSFEPDSSALLGASLLDDGHWHVLADGRRIAARAPSQPGHSPLLETSLPSATERVDLLYRPVPFVLGMACAAVGIAWLAALGLTTATSQPLVRRPAAVLDRIAA